MRARLISVASLLAWGLCAPAGAQVPGVQRIVGPDGRVTYTDRPGLFAPAAPTTPAAAPSQTPSPVPAAEPAAANAGPPSASTSLNTAALPFALRQVVQRYPVTLYTGEKCSPCDSARNLLTQRGVPFVEKTVTTSDDAQAFARVSTDNTVPLITIGAQRVLGSQAGDLNRYLDAAGYPAQSLLPRSHRNPAPQPLAGPAAASSPAPQAAGNTGTPESMPQSSLPAASRAPVTPAPANPAGIRF